MPHFDGRGFRIDYVEEGSGPAIVFAHGGLIDHTMFAPQFEDLPDRYRCIAWDMRGHGRSAAPDGRWTLQDVVVDLIAFIEATNAAPCHLVGHSIGGYAALRVAIQREDLVRSVVLMGASADSGDGLDAIRGVIADVERSGEVTEQHARMFADFQFGEPYRTNEPEAVEIHVDRARSMPSTSIAEVLRCAVERDSVVDRLGEIRVPTLIVHGELDQTVSSETAEQLASGIMGAELVSVPGAAHVTPLEAPDVVNEALAGFFSRVKR